jgi:ribonuclease VapC
MAEFEGACMILNRRMLLAAASGLAVWPAFAHEPPPAAHLQFGKGTGHSAALNYGDCFAYALAKAMNASLLRKGNDFPLTDICIA